MNRSSRTLNMLINRFASREQIILLFAACVFIIHVWSIINVLREVPAWVLRLNYWDLLGVIAYTQVYALVESVIVLVGVIIIAALLPAKLFRNKFVAVGTMAVLVTSIWFILAHYNDEIIRLWGAKQFLLVLLVFLVSLVVPYILIQRYHKLEETISTIVQRIAVLAFVYIVIDVLSIIIIIIRNR